MTSTLEAINEKMADLEQMWARQGEEQRKLQQSIALMNLWPEVFQNGKIKVKWRRTPKGRSGSVITYKETCVITDGKGEKRSFPGDQVPDLIARPWNQGKKDA